MKRNAVIFDIDGTLSDCKHRRHWVEGKKKNWDKFYEEVGNDNPKWNTIHFLSYLASSCPEDEMLFVSGRPERCRQDTLAWFQKMLQFQPGHLFMRPDGNFTPDNELKKKIYLERIEPFYNVKLVLDDRDRVVKMWRSLGLECWQVAEGDF